RSSKYTDGRDQGAGSGGEPDGTAPVSGRRLGTVAEHAAMLSMPGVLVRAAEANVERRGDRGFDDATVRRRVSWRILADGAPDGWCASGCERGDGEGSESGGDVVGEVVGAGGSPAERLVPLGAMADHRVEGVDRAVSEDPGGAGDRGPAQRCDHRVDRVLGDRFDGRAHESWAVESFPVSPDERLHAVAGTVEVTAVDEVEC